MKRGGGITLVSLVFESAERELALATPAVEDCFQKQWVRGLFELAAAALRQRGQSDGRQLQFCVFERYDLTEERITYGQLPSNLERPLLSLRPLDIAHGVERAACIRAI